MDRDLAVHLIALALIGGCAWFAVATGTPALERDRPRDKRARRRRDVAPHALSGAAPPAEAIAARAIGVPDASGLTRPRIFTGEAAPAEDGRPAMMRALKLAGGMTALAAAGAIGLLVLVRALMSMFERIGS